MAVVHRLTSDYPWRFRLRRIIRGAGIARTVAVVLETVAERLVPGTYLQGGQLIKEDAMIQNALALERGRIRTEEEG